MEYIILLRCLHVSQWNPFDSLCPVMLTSEFNMYFKTKRTFAKGIETGGIEPRFCEMKRLAKFHKDGCSKLFLLMSF